MLMVLASLAFTLMVACVKVARAELSALEIAAWRGLGSIPLALFFARGAGWKVQARGWMGIRIVIGFGAMTCFFTAARGLAVADLALISRLQPILIALLAPVILGAAERSDRRLWGLMGVGMLGCAVLLGPGMVIGNIYGLWALGAILLSTFAHITLRALGATDDPRIVVLYFQIGVTVLAVGAAYLQLGELPPPPSAHLWLPLFGVGVLATTAQLLMTQAYALDSAARVSAASHSSPLWALFIDIFLFDLWPTPEMLLGGTVVMLAVLGLVHSHRHAPKNQPVEPRSP
jgi:drug/metabolite transporter (DMT)-like permease